jgi:hypothetical protein
MEEADVASASNPSLVAAPLPALLVRKNFMIRTDSGVTVRIGQRRPRPGKRQPGSRVPLDGKCHLRPAISTLPGRIWSVRPPRGPPACAGASSWVLCGTNLVEAMLVRGQISRGLSARVEGESDRPDLAARRTRSTHAPKPSPAFADRSLRPGWRDPFSE